MKLYRYSLNAAAGLAGLAAMSGTAHADNVDYGALEQLFNEPVTTSATGAPQRATEAPVNMTIITQDEIKRSGAIDIPGVLERYANVDVVRSAAGDANVSIRGYDTGYSPRLLVLVNGRQVYLDHYGMTNWNLIPVQMSEIRQIEIVSGPNTALFGFNAVSGVVNIITTDPLEDNVSAASVTVGDNDYRSVSGVVTHAINDDVSLRLSGGGTESDGWDGDADNPTLYNPGLDQRRFNAQLGMRFNPRARGNLEFSAAHDNRQEELPDGQMIATKYNTTGIKGDLSVETGMGLFEGQAYFNTLVADFGTSSGAILPFENRIFVAQGSWLNRLSPDHTVRLALEYRHNWIPLPDVNAQATTDVFSLSGMWNWQIRQNLASTTAIRLDRLELDRDGTPATSSGFADYNTDMDEPSLNFGLVWRPSDVDSFRFSAARGVQSPSMLDYGYDMGNAVPGMHYTGNPDVKPTIVENIEFGWDRAIAPINGRLRASVYWQHNDNLKIANSNANLTFPGPILHVYPDNIGSSEMTGIDLSLDGKQGDISWMLTYSHRDIDDDLTTVSPTSSSPTGCYPGSTPLGPGLTNCVAIDYEDTSPSDVATAAVNWTHGAFELGADVRHVSSVDRLTDSSLQVSRHSIDAYNLVNARAAWNATEWLTVALAGRNLFDDETETTAFSPIPRAFYLTLSSNF